MARHERVSVVFKDCALAGRKACCTREGGNIAGGLADSSKLERKSDPPVPVLNDWVSRQIQARWTICSYLPPGVELNQLKFMSRCVVILFRRLDLVGNRVSVPRVRALQETYEYDCAVTDIVRHANSLSCCLTPFQFGILNKKGIALIPAGYLDPVDRHCRGLRCARHSFALTNSQQP